MTPEPEECTLVMTGSRAAYAEAHLQRLHDAVSRGSHCRQEQHCRLRVLLVAERYPRIIFRFPVEYSK
jgi:hypothetical protein